MTCNRCGGEAKGETCLACLFALKEQAKKPVEFVDPTEHMAVIWNKA